jgi:hypothetical protein
MPMPQDKAEVYGAGRALYPEEQNRQSMDDGMRVLRASPDDAHVERILSSSLRSNGLYRADPPHLTLQTKGR